MHVMGRPKRTLGNYLIRKYAYVKDGNGHHVTLIW